MGLSRVGVRRGAPGEDTGGSRLDADGTVDRRWLSGDVGCRATSRGTPSLCEERVGSSSSLTGGDGTSPVPLLSLPSCLDSLWFLVGSSELSEALPPTPAAARSTVAAPPADAELVVPAEKPTASPVALTLDRAVSEGWPAGAIVSAWATPVNTLSAWLTEVLTSWLSARGTEAHGDRSAGSAKAWDGMRCAWAPLFTVGLGVGATRDADDAAQPIVGLAPLQQRCGYDAAAGAGPGCTVVLLQAPGRGTLPQINAPVWAVGQADGGSHPATATATVRLAGGQLTKQRPSPGGSFHTTHARESAC